MGLEGLWGIEEVGLDPGQSVLGKGGEPQEAGLAHYTIINPCHFPFQLQTLSQNRQLTPSSYDAQELTDTVMHILGNAIDDDTSDSAAARELSHVRDLRLC